MFLCQKQRIPIRLICLPAALRRLPEAAKGGDQGRQTERPRHQPLVFEIPQVYVFHHQCPGRPVVHGGRRHNLPPSLASGASFQKLEVAVSNQCPEKQRPERILCLIYGRLIVILVVQRLLALASVQAAAEQRELSFCKASQWLMRGGRLLKAFLDRQFGDLLRRMLSCLKRLLKQKAHDVAIDRAASGVFGQLCGYRPLRQRGVDPGWLCLA